MRALFDTSVVSYWAWGCAEFQPSLQDLMHKMCDARAQLYLSVVSLQELAVAEQMRGALQGWVSRLEKDFTVLPFTKPCALAAAEIQVEIGRPSPSGKAERLAAKSIWFRDAAIAATAIVHDVDLLVSADKGFLRFQRHFTGRVRILAPREPVEHGG